jgi:hypothetical protein
MFERRNQCGIFFIFPALRVGTKIIQSLYAFFWAKKINLTEENWKIIVDINLQNRPLNSC